MRASIRNRLTYAFIGFSVIPLLLVGIGIVWQIVRVQQEQVLILEQQLAQQVADEMDGFVHSLEEDLQSIVQVNSLLNLTPAEQKIVLSELLAFQTAFDELALLDRRGKEKIRLARLNLVTTDDLTDRATADEFTQPMGTKETYYSSVWFDELSGEPLLTISVPLIDLRDDQIEGVLVANIRLKKIWDLIAGIPVESGESIYIVNAQGRLIAHGNPSFVLRNMDFVVPAKGGVAQGLENTAVFLAKEEIQFGEQTFIVIAEREIFEAMALVVDTVLITGTMIIIVYFIASIFGIGIVRQIVQPIQALAVTASEIEAGDLSGRVEVPQHEDEVRDLALAFNSMAIQLQQSMSGLEQHIQKLQETEKALTDYAVELERSNHELQSFAYIASHDLQEPLRKIQTFSDRMYSMYADSLDERGLDYLNRMQSAGGRMQTLIQDLLSFSHVTTHAQTFSPVDLKQTVDDVIEDLEIRIEETHAQIRVGDLPIIEADPLQMRQLFQNLLSNALKFRQNEVAPIISITSESVPALGGEDLRWHILVEDNGIGFDEKYLDRIFTLFQRLHSRREYVGTGVGLAICRKIIERHSGQITAHSELGNGTQFVVSLPGSQT